MVSRLYCTLQCINGGSPGPAASSLSRQQLGANSPGPSDTMTSLIMAPVHKVATHLKNCDLLPQLYVGVGPIGLHFAMVHHENVKASVVCGTS